MYYFDNKYLAQYIDQGVELWVYDGYAWYEIADASDLEDLVKGYGYDTTGRGHKFQYKNIEQIKVAGKIFTLDQLQAQRTGQPSSDTDKSPSGKKDGLSSEELPDEEPPEEEKPEKKEKEPELSWRVYDIGRDLIQELRKQKDAINH